jgi:hypothetical protein
MGEVIKPKKPLNEYLKANWDDHIEMQEGCTIHVNSTSNLITMVSKLKDKQWEKVFVAALASGRCKNMKAVVAALAAMDSDSSQAAMVAELWDDDSDLSDD